MKLNKKHQCFGAIFCLFSTLLPAQADANSDWPAIPPASLALLRALADVEPTGAADDIQDQIVVAKRRFEAVDRNGDGVQLTDLLYRTQLLNAAKTYANIEQLFHTDLNQDGHADRIEMEQFVQLYANEFMPLAEKNETPQQLAIRLADIAMRKYDRNSDEIITRGEAIAVERDFYQAVRNVAYAQVEDEFQIWLGFDKNKDGVVAFAEIEPHLRGAILKRGNQPQASIPKVAESFG